MNFISSLIKKNGPIIGTYLLIAIIFWFIFLIIIPQLYMVDLSFRPNLSPLERGGDKDFYTLAVDFIFPRSSLLHIMEYDDRYKADVNESRIHS